MITRIQLTVVALFSILLISCDDSVVFEENKTIDGGVWKNTENVHMQFNISDTVSFHDFYINFRNGEEYAYSNIYVFMEMEFPNAKKSIDTINCYLADPTGKWLGTGVGSLYDQRFKIRHRKQFPLAGRYTVTIRQAMRTPELEGIYDVGFRVAKSE
ncbi:MAG: gliding motility lipoprotein GldH [Bacteroidota bacterium]|jgi:gliding motility-associated lipoprotein GldH